MKKWLLVMVGCGVFFPPCAMAIPNAVLGAIRESASPLDGQDLTEPMIAAIRDGGTLPGNWREEGMIESARLTHLLARPHLFGEPVTLVRALHREEKLESLEFTFADAGSYFGYFSSAEEVDKTLSRKEQQAWLNAKMAEKQQKFATEYERMLASLRVAIQPLVGKGRSKMIEVGKTRALRAELEEWKLPGYTLRLLADGNRLIRIVMLADQKPMRTWLDASLADQDIRARLSLLRQRVEKQTDGTVMLPTLRPIPQGYQPYCGLNTLAMAARHFGLHIDEEWLAVAGKFQNTGSAAGSDMLGLYQAVAAEAGLHLDRQSQLDISSVQRAIDQGMPVIVWRRFSQERNQVHDDFLREWKADPTVTLPNPAGEKERLSWPDAKAPLHASVIVGYHTARGEFLFLESWTGKDQARRMTAAEMAATTYYSFVFQP